MLDKLESFIKSKARPIDRELYFLLSDKGKTKSLLGELKKFQNKDGGFGHAIEPDLRASVSTPIGTSVATQYLVQSRGSDDSLIGEAVSYFSQTFDREKLGWKRIVEAVDSAPHAPWWRYDENKLLENWANPTVEITAFLDLHKEYLDKVFPLEELHAKVESELFEMNDPEPHDLLCYKRFVSYLPGKLTKRAQDVLLSMIEQVVSTDESEWSLYVPRPLDFIDSPESLFCNLFSDQVIEKNLEYLLQSVVNDHWEPTWDWGEESKAWDEAKLEWSSYLTVQNTLKLKAFGRL